MKLKEQQKIQEDIYNEKIKIAEREDARLEYRETPKSLLGPQNRNTVEIKSLYLLKHLTPSLHFLKTRKGNIYLVPRYFLERIKDIAYKFRKRKENFSNKSQPLFLHIISNYLLINSQQSDFKYPDNILDKELFKNLVKQQIIMSGVVRNYYLEKLNKLSGGEDNIIKYLNNELSDEEIQKLHKNIKIGTFTKVDTLLTYIENQFNENKNKKIEDFIKNNKYYEIYLRPNINYTIDLYITKFNIKDDELSTIYYNFYDVDRYFNKIEGLKGGNSKFVISTDNKKDFIKALADNNFLNKEKIYNKVSKLGC